jgi:hypothetical protein
VPGPGIVLVVLQVVGDTLFLYEYLIANVERRLKLGLRGDFFYDDRFAHFFSLASVRTACALNIIAL